MEPKWEQGLLSEGRSRLGQIVFFTRVCMWGRDVSLEIGWYYMRGLSLGRMGSGMR